ncbi:MAG: DUF433 domain-containing protein [Chloroflexota bacterium]|nr:DUF433 domain-containing protein [Chloroflexota bacterium]
MAKDAPPDPDRIVQDPEIMVGQPVVKGTRIPAALVLEQLAATPDLDELFAAYPRLTVEDVRAVLAYAHAAVESQRERTKWEAPRIVAPTAG